jgi:hypothetical protein
MVRRVAPLGVLYRSIRAEDAGLRHSGGFSTVQIERRKVSGRERAGEEPVA